MVVGEKSGFEPPESRDAFNREHDARVRIEEDLTAVDWLSALDRQAARKHEQDLLSAAIERGASFHGLQHIGEAHVVSGVFSFLLEGTHAADVGMLLDQQGVAVRTGHHCAQPIMDQYEIYGTVRASFALYNTLEEVERLFDALAKVREMLL